MLTLVISKLSLCSLHLLRKASSAYCSSLFIAILAISVFRALSCWLALCEDATLFNADTPKKPPINSPLVILSAILRTSLSVFAKGLNIFLLLNPI